MTASAAISAEERAQLRETIREIVADRASLAEARRLVETDAPFDRESWGAFAELGIAGLIVPEEHGGAGLGVRELAIVAEETGRALHVSPLLSTVALATSAIVASGDEAACADLLPGIAAGSTIATLAFLEDASDWSLARIATEGRPDGDGWLLSGTKTLVVDGNAAGLVLVLGSTADGPALFAVDPSAPGCTVTALSAMDRTRPLAELAFAETPARLVGVPGGGGAAVRHALEVAAATLAAEQVGGALHCLVMSSDYARDRVQFSRRIGSFQAIKHACANMLVALEPARSAALAAAEAIDEDAPHRSVAVSLAQAVCSDAFFAIARDTIQVHGGVGFTWEHDAHLFFKRAKASELTLGDARFHRGRMARLLGLAPGAEGVW